MGRMLQVFNAAGWGGGVGNLIIKLLANALNFGAVVLRCTGVGCDVVEDKFGAEGVYLTNVQLQGDIMALQVAKNQCTSASSGTDTAAFAAW